MAIVSYLTELKQKIQTRLNDINDKLASKGQSRASDLSEVPALIEAISSGSGSGGIDTTISTDAASASDILSGKRAYVNGSLITGNIPSIAAKTYTPTTSNQTISSGRYLSGTQTILGDANLVAGNIRNGVSIFGVNGSYTASGSGGIDTSDATVTSRDMPDGVTAYANGQKVTGDLYMITEDFYLEGDIRWIYDEGFEEYGVKETCTFNDRYVIEKGVAFHAFTRGSLLGDATASDVAAGKTFTSANGMKITGTRTDSSGGGSGEITEEIQSLMSTITTKMGGLD